MQLVEQPGGGLRFGRDARGIDRSLQAFRVRKTANRQRRRGQPHELHEARATARGVARK